MAFCSILAVFLVVALNVAAGVFNYTKCPAPWEIQSDAVKQSFSLKKLVGSYYELALHDYTQYPICPKPSCIQSHKVLDLEHSVVNDTFNLVCLGGDYKFQFRFALTNTTGFFLGRVAEFPYIVFPDTVVDVKESEDGSQYEWVIEMQCVEKLNHVWFVGINFYSRVQNATKEYVDEMLKAATDRGLGFFMNHGVGVLRVNQNNCTKT